MTNKLFPEMRRRQFLTYGSCGALSLALTASGASAWSGAMSQVTPADAQVADLISVGYLPGSASLAQAEQLVGNAAVPHLNTPTIPRDAKPTHAPFYPHLIAAESLPSGDPHFAHTGAKISIHGIFPFETFKMYPDLHLWAIDVEYKAVKRTTMFHA